MIKQLGVLERQTIQDGRVVKRESIPAALNAPLPVVWFDIGQRMKDIEGKDVVMSVSAHTRLQYNDYLAKGWKPIINVPVEKAADALPPDPAPIVGVTTRKKGRPRNVDK